MSQFVLLPWEHELSGANPRPHATARLTVGGKARNFVLKIHDGTLFFKEPSRAQVFAVLDEFDSNLARDHIGLVSRWQNHVAENNYGAFVTKRDYFTHLPVRANILMIFKADGTGWMKEHFDSEWFLLPNDAPKPANSGLDLWNPEAVEAHVQKLLPPVQRQLINRALTPEILAADPPRWNAESGERIAELLVAAARLFTPSCNASSDLRTVSIKSHSTFAEGEIKSHWFKRALRYKKALRFYEILEPHIQFLGVRWNEGGEHLEQYGRRRNEKIFQAGLEKWGTLWRGNWAPQRASFKIELSEQSAESAHEKMEAALVLREWLEGKMPEAEIEELLSR